MNTHLRAHVGRRRAALERLQGLTAGVVVAGIAGTIGFGALAAATFRGTSSAQAATGDDEPAAAADDHGGSAAQSPQPRTNTTDQNLVPAPTPRPARNHQGHAATGGSG